MSTPSLNWSVCVLLALGLALSGCSGQSEDQLLRSAKVSVAKDDTKAAAIQLKNVLQQNPQSGEARMLLGRVLLRSGDPAGAVAELERANDLRQPADQVYPSLAQAMVMLGQGKKVTERFEEIVLADAKAGAELKAMVAAGYVAQNKLPNAEASVNAALQLDPKNTTARMLRVRLMAGRGGMDEALAEMSRIVVDDPGRPEAWQLQAELLWFGKADLDAAIQSAKRVLTIDPRYVSAHDVLIRLYLQKRDVAAFRVQAAELKKAWPKHPTAQLYDTQLKLMDHDIKRAREGVQQLLRLAPDSIAALQLAGAVEFEAGSLGAAQTHLNKAIQLSPEEPVARRLLAETHLRAGSPGKALAALQPLLRSGKATPEVIALAAQAHLQSGDLDQAEAYYILATKANPADAKSRTALALTQLARGYSQGGFAQLESLASSDSSTFADLALISARIKRTEYDNALKAIERLQTKLPGKPLPFVLRGRVQMLKKEMAAARASFDQALVVDPSFFPATLALAQLDVLENKLPDAAKRFEAALAREPQNYAASVGLAELRMHAGAKPEDVEALLVNAVKASPGEPLPRLALIEHQLLRRDRKAALVAAQEAGAVFPDNVVILDALGRAQLASGAVEQAISTFNKVTTAASSLPDPQLRLADAYMAKRDYAAAAQSLRRALEIAPNHLPAQRAMVRMALLRKRSDEALQVARSVQKQRPKEAIGYLMEGEIHAAVPAWEQALAAFRLALERGGTTDIAVRLHAAYALAGRPAEADRFAETWLRQSPADADFLFHLGTMAMERKNYATAESRYRQVLTLRPDNASANNNIASMLVIQGKEGALPFAERANQLLPNQAAILDTLAAALVANKDYKRALEIQRKAMELAPTAQGYRLNLAKLLIQTGDKVSARAELERLAALGDKFVGQAEVVDLLKGL